MRWEYKIITLCEVTETKLNELGEQGWELVQMTKFPSILSYELVFKKVICEDD